MSKVILNNRNNSFITIFIRMLLLACLGALSACSNPNNPQSYLKTFDHILTDQYVWSYGRGGIYWVSNEKVVLEAQIQNDLGVLTHGLFEVDVRDGSSIKLVDVPKSGPYPYKYCFDGSVLHVMTNGGAFELINQSKNYQVKIREVGKKNQGNSYSPLRCGFFDLPIEAKSRFIPLKSENGFMKNQAGATKEGPVMVLLTDEQGTSLKEIAQLPSGSSGVIGMRRFAPHLNAYFGHTAFNKYCTDISWLYREGWKLEQETLCLKDLATNRIFVHSIKNGFYLEQYNVRSSPSYILLKNKLIKVEEGIGRGASVSPNGCLIAYGVGDSKRKNSGVRQKLKLFNYCDYQQKGQKS
jgi:hypothetical protein